jgi:hypothetical protein
VNWDNVFMGYNFAGGGEDDQVFLMPPDPRDWLPAGHLAWAMRRAARELDLAPFLAAYRADGQGKTAYHPRMMVALVMYCYCKGIRSSRAIEMATWDDVGARVICGGLHPDHATNARFVRRHEVAAGQRPAAGRAEEAAAAPAVPAAPARPPEVNTTDPASRVMPLRKGGFDQLCNLQAFAGRRQVIFATGTHDITNDLGALHPLLDAAAANLAAAGITSTIGKALSDAGYASGDNFTTPYAADLYVAVTRESRQTGKSAEGRGPAAVQSWQQMAAKLDSPEGQAIYQQRKAIAEPVFAQLSARFGRALHYRGDMAQAEVHLRAAVHNMVKATTRPPDRAGSTSQGPASISTGKPPLSHATASIRACSVDHETGRRSQIRIKATPPGPHRRARSTGQALTSHALRCDEGRDGARADRPAEPVVEGRVFALEGLALGGGEPGVERHRAKDGVELVGGLLDELRHHRHLGVAEQRARVIPRHVVAAEPGPQR